MRGGNAGFILRGVYRMQCAYHSSSWTRSSVKVPVGWTCWQGWLLQMLAGMSFLSPDCSLHFQSEPQNLLGFSCTQPETYARIHRMWPQSMMCPPKKAVWRAHGVRALVHHKRMTNRGQLSDLSWSQFQHYCNIILGTDQQPGDGKKQPKLKCQPLRHHVDSGWIALHVFASCLRGNAMVAANNITRLCYTRDKW